MGHCWVSRPCFDKEEEDNPESTGLIVRNPSGLAGGKLRTKGIPFIKDSLNAGTTDFNHTVVKVPKLNIEESKDATSKSSTSFVQHFKSIEGFEQYLREDEKGLSKDSIIEQFNKLETEWSTEGTGWQPEKLVGSDNIQAWGNMKGTYLNNKVPCLRVDWTPKPEFTVDEILNAFYNKESRMKWDDKVAEMKEINKSHPNFNIVVTRNVKILLFDARQFFDKRVVFQWNDENSNNPTENRACIFVYSSSLPEEQEKIVEEENKPENDKIKYVTGTTVLFIQKISFDYKTRKDVKLSAYNQIDGKLGFGAMVAAKAMPKLTQQWFLSLEKYLDKPN